jgi:hypothetical protein
MPRKHSHSQTNAEIEAARAAADRAVSDLAAAREQDAKAAQSEQADLAEIIEEEEALDGRDFETGQPSPFRRPPQALEEWAIHPAHALYRERDRLERVEERMRERTKFCPPGHPHHRAAQRNLAIAEAETLKVQQRIWWIEENWRFATCRYEECGRDFPASLSWATTGACPTCFGIATGTLPPRERQPEYDVYIGPVFGA